MANRDDLNLQRMNRLMEDFARENDIIGWQPCKTGWTALSVAGTQVCFECIEDEPALAVLVHVAPLPHEVHARMRMCETLLTENAYVADTDRLTIDASEGTAVFQRILEFEDLDGSGLMAEVEQMLEEAHSLRKALATHH